MSGLGDFAKKAEQAGKDHSENVGKGIDEAEKAANEHTGNKYEKQVAAGGDQAKKRFGGGEQGQQDDQQDPRAQQQQGQ